MEKITFNLTPDPELLEAYAQRMLDGVVNRARCARTSEELELAADALWAVTMLLLTCVNPDKEQVDVPSLCRIVKAINAAMETVCDRRNNLKHQEIEGE